MSVGPAAGSSGAGALQWQRLSLLRGRLLANCQALAGRDKGLSEQLAAFVPAADIVIAFRDEQVILANLTGTTAQVRRCVLPAAAARQALLKIYPGGRCTEGLLVAGVDQGWLWNFAYRMETAASMLPGHRPPLYFLARQIEELWAALHLHDWRDLLADPRVRLYVGPEAMRQMREGLDLRVPWPRVSVTLDPALWTCGKDLDETLAPVQQKLLSEYQAVREGYAEQYAWATQEGLAAKIGGGKALRVLGITSRYTTFLQYSMRDWLAAFQKLGHQTRLLIEESSEQVLSPVYLAKACAAYAPDLLVLIDHARGEFGGTLPAPPVSVMWVQDKLPNIFSKQGAEHQGSRDYCLGFGRLFLSQNYGYPASRFMEATVGVNEERFAPGELTPEEMGRYGCEVAYVSHASVPAETLLQRQLEEVEGADGKRLLTDMFERLKGAYEAGEVVFHQVQFQQIMEEASAATGVGVAPERREALLDFFSHKINNAMFRHQALHWLADLDVDFHLYGKGWEEHPRFKKHARGVADNERQLATIFRASRINLQVTPHGAVHQRLFEGLASGGFFLIRHTPGETGELLYRPLWGWCQKEKIGSDEELRRRATPEIQALLAELGKRLRLDPFRLGSPLVELLRLSADTGFTRAAASIWPEYEQVAFRSREELHQKVRYYLAHEQERQQIGASMAEAVRKRFTYVEQTRRLLGFIAQDLARQAEGKAEPAA